MTPMAGGSHCFARIAFFSRPGLLIPAVPASPGLLR